MSFDDQDPADLARAGFKRHLLAENEKRTVEASFAGYIDEVLEKINDGKEATVYLCRAVESLGTPYLAAKIYRARVFRAFDTDLQYRNLGKMRDRRMAKAMRGRSRAGARTFHYRWIDSEWRVMCQLLEAGVAVPKPYQHCADGILMEYFEVDGHPAPRLNDVRLPPTRARDLFDQLIEEVARMLECDLVHGDLSAYNILYSGEEYRIIDLPQAVDLRTMPDAHQMLERDITNLCKYFQRQGVDVDPAPLADRLWSDAFGPAWR